MASIRYFNASLRRFMFFGDVIPVLSKPQFDPVQSAMIKLQQVTAPSAFASSETSIAKM